ncbi:YifB family Mg chelatase-like AAA ATPase [Cetobacterium sp. 8H]|uniref:YifB family Mg chelatase-like AAA ATPase n=1 Tax=Cetobacterium sp. 8H TaxID=2759681 RepID=UPI00163C8F8F|nr:YifB family Mg chelatase-like AAA ATPase [Cetobacterium sp. 8H]MBC2851390.1 YifB family Mg chelatase-like AAA ATPase [Cetobacterium sp. 8H]
MLVKILSSSYLGIEPFLVEVEVDVVNGLPIFNIVGLGDATISESRDRIRSAIKNMGYMLEPRRLIVNLTPANVKKSGSHFDLPIALGIMLGMKFISDYRGILSEYLVMGELSLTGEVRRAEGVISGVLMAKSQGFKGVIIPESNFEEASIIKGIHIVPVKNIRDAVNFIELGEIRSRRVANCLKEQKVLIDMWDVKGQSTAKRALEISAAGGHNIIMVGAPGSGKSMLAKRLITILPPMSEKEIIETTKIYSVSGELDEKNPIIVNRPFRDPHHTSTATSIIGGGRIPKPGEISLSNNGVLFLDEFTEFDRVVTESLREPLEEKRISITRSLGKMEFPAKMIFVAACNPCPCGNGFDEDLCTCTPFDIRRYAKKLSGPIIDRIDLYIEIYRLNENEILKDSRGDRSELIRERVLEARIIQNDRFGQEKLNADMLNQDIEKYCILDKECEKIIRGAIRSLNLSMRTYHKILKVARTIADLSGSKNIEKPHLMEAITYRKN